MNKMKYDIIKTDNYLLVVDESEIKESNFGYNTISKTIDVFTKSLLQNKQYYKNIISHLPLNGSPILEGVDLLPPLEDDNSNKDLFYQKQVMNPYPTGGQSYASYEKGFVEGYNKAKEKYKYTEEDLRKAIDIARDCESDCGAVYFMGGTTEEIIQSLSQPKMPIGFDLQIGVCERWLNEDCTDNCCGIPEKKITTTTPEGHTQWVGTYIY